MKGFAIENHNIEIFSSSGIGLILSSALIEILAVHFLKILNGIIMIKKSTTMTKNKKWGGKYIVAKFIQLFVK
jgi:hypothetical protein